MTEVKLPTSWKNVRNRRAFGKAQEDLASSYLQDQGLIPVLANYQCRLGEIDLVMMDGNTLVFVEVRYRRRNDFGSALESVTYKKQQKIILCARHLLLHRRQLQSFACRFDVVAVSPQKGLDQIQFDWVRNAFS